jgi:hypothetical protein
MIDPSSNSMVQQKLANDSAFRTKVGGTGDFSVTVMGDMQGDSLRVSSINVP